MSWPWRGSQMSNTWGLSCPSSRVEGSRCGMHSCTCSPLRLPKCVVLRGWDRVTLPRLRLANWAGEGVLAKCLLKQRWEERRLDALGSGTPRTSALPPVKLLWVWSPARPHLSPEPDPTTWGELGGKHQPHGSQSPGPQGSAFGSGCCSHTHKSSLGVRTGCFRRGWGPHKCPGPLSRTRVMKPALFP